MTTASLLPHATDEFVVVATFPSVPEAEACKLSLEVEGLAVHLADAETITMDWLLGNALGYVKVLVPVSQVEKAQQLLAQHQKPHLSPEERENEPETCLSCGTVLLSNQSRCDHCGWSYLDGAEIEQSQG